MFDIEISFEEAKRIAEEYSMFKHKIGEKGGKTLHLFSYSYQHPPLFKKEPKSRALRGTVFDDEGTIVARPFTKFFNYQGFINEIEPDEVVSVTKKVDGSMATAFSLDGEVYFTSKGSFDSWVVERAQEVVTEEQKDLVQTLGNWDFSIVFELFDPKHPIVIPHEERQLIAVGAVSHTSGIPMRPTSFIRKCRRKDVPHIEHLFSFSDGITIEEVQQWLNNKKEIEGVVCYNQQRRMCKIKTEWYLDRHKYAFMDEDAIRHFFITGELDDIYPKLHPDLQEKVDELLPSLREKIEEVVEGVTEFVHRKEWVSRKEFALTVIEEVEKPLRSVLFRVYDGVAPRTAVINHFKERW